MEIHDMYPCHPRNYQRGRSGPIKFLVVHYVGATGGAEANCKYYGGTQVGASAHYFVGHAPGCEVWQSVAVGDTAWHCGRTDGRYRHPECRNANSIGVELCCHQRADGTWYFDDETVDAAVALCRELMARHGIDADHVVRHFDVTGKVCPAPFVLDAEAWAALKNRLEDVEMSREEIEALVAREVKAAIGAYEDAVAEANHRPVSPWAAAQWGRAVKAGVFDGTRPCAPLRREEAAVVLDRLGIL